PFVLICRTGSRTATVGNFLANQMGYTNAMHLGGGIYAWHAEGNDFEPI
ncbi:MAG: rhodanese-like domain-containing protein, partial [Epsilonproteobacteria bacterium]|nr:rhodanese-like domain-containing protein [Campylobacterota bacterium]